ncbi:reverse transcriptase [Senna tora]|uniref:Reverse transcriptase n=1 Tax=Senna tora TaxID=362788 RepID=A0A835C7W9_9FABA|nr:reverse transcriptase [Senna tora]
MDTKLWFNIWVGEQPLIDYDGINLDLINDISALVSSIIVNKRWHLEELSAICPQDINNKILSIPLPVHSQLPDVLIWGKSPDGIYSAKSRYQFLSGSQESKLSHDFREKIPSFFVTDDLTFWFLSSADYRSSTEGTRDIEFLNICYDIWKMRNAYVIEGKLPNKVKMCRDIVLNIENARAVFGNSSRGPSRDSINVGWVKPKNGFIKLNTDGSSIGNPGPVGVGGLFRDSDGRWLLGFSGSIGYQTNMFAELNAIKHGLALASREPSDFIHNPKSSNGPMLSNGLLRALPHVLLIDFSNVKCDAISHISAFAPNMGNLDGEVLFH